MKLISQALAEHGLDPGLTGLLPDWLIEECIGIDPIARGEPRSGKISFGTSSMGYDARIGYKFKVFDPVSCAIVDPKATQPESYREVDLTPGTEPRHKVTIDTRNPTDPQAVCCVCGAKVAKGFEEQIKGWRCGRAHLDHILLPPNSYALGETVETFHIPRDVIAVCLGKSTYARKGIIVNVTPLEPEWQGKVTVEISNSSPLPAKVYAGEGIMQVVFLRALAPCQKSYADKKPGGGKYQNQTGLTDAKVD